MKREIPESVADAIRTIKSFCDSGQNKFNCDVCPFNVPYDSRHSDTFCLFNKTCPSCWNVDEEKHYYIEYGEKE